MHSFLKTNSVIYLIIETSSSNGIFSILKEDHVVFHQKLAFGVRESNELIPAIDMGMQQLKLNFKDVSGIILGKGPGSFTGIRIGASIAKALSYAHDIPIYTINSMQTLTPPKLGDFYVLLDAKSKGIFYLKGTKSPEGIEYAQQPQVCLAKDLSTSLDSDSQWLCSHKSSLVNKITDEEFNKIVELYPDPIQMKSLAQIKVQKSPYKGIDPLNLSYFAQPV